MNISLLERIDDVLAHSAEYDSNTGVAPVAVLWPDESRQWESVIPELRKRKPIINLGTADPDNWQGPAYWVRCIIAGTIETTGLSGGTPIVYLPGVSREMMRSLESLPPDLLPLGALQHQCRWFTHVNGKDWTIRALISNEEHGFHLSVASDSATTQALVASLPVLLTQSLSKLESKHIDADFLNSLINPDPVRVILNFINDPTATRAAMSEGAWDAFFQQSKSEFGYDPSIDGEIDGARRLGEAEGLWGQVWQRFRENPTDYPQIPERLRLARPAELFAEHNGAWPQDNEQGEDQLRTQLNKLSLLTAEDARNVLRNLEEAHRQRRNTVWAQIGKAPLAGSLEHLAEMAKLTMISPPSGSVDEIAAWYTNSGWQADGAAMRALAEVRANTDLEAVESALAAVYQPWLNNAANALQNAIGPVGGLGSYEAGSPPELSAGEVVIFVDGLRLDIAHRLSDRLKGAGLEIDLSSSFAALPTVTQTAKPALVPIDQSVLAGGKDLDACRAPDGPSANVQVLRSLMANAEIQALKSDEVGDPTGMAWTEAGKVDSQGHALGKELVYALDDEVQRIATRIGDLFDAGWSRVSVVTDHGWLLLPSGLPKNDSLPVAVTHIKKGRCARVKEGAVIDVPTVPWHWDNAVRIAVAPGISCFEANNTYEHGGISPQECVVPRMSVTRSNTLAAGAAVTSIKWIGLTLAIEFTGLPDHAKVDLRKSAADPSSSIAEMGRGTGGKGKIFLIVPDEDQEGQDAKLVVTDGNESLLLQQSITVGQNR